MNQIDIQKMNEQIYLLESRQAFQDLTIEQLNQSIIDQQKQIQWLQERVRILSEKLKAAQPSMLATQAEETPPPHY